MSKPIGNLSNDSSFNSTLKLIKTGWLFSNAHADSFPHETETDGDVVPSFIEKLLSDGFQNLVLIPGDNPTCVEACLTAWNLEINCVCVSFVHEMSESGITHNTKPFVQDFPLNVWLFENLTNTKAKSLEPEDKKFKLKFHPVVNIPSAIFAEISRSELLFLMRLGDSLSNFQVMIEEIFTFKSSDESDAGSSDNFNAPTESKSLIAARRKQQITDVAFEFTGCILIKCFHINVNLPTNKKQASSHPLHSEAEETPTHQSSCKILLRAPTIDEGSKSLHSAVITGPISVSPDPGLQYALQMALPGSPRLYTPRSQSPSVESSSDTLSTLSHSGSLASMNIDEATIQFIGYQEDDFYMISQSDITEKDNTPVILQGSLMSVTEGLQFGPQENVKQKQHNVSQSQLIPQSQIEQAEEMLPECCPSYDQPVDANCTPNLPGDQMLSQGNFSHQAVTQPQKYLPPANLGHHAVEHPQKYLSPASLGNRVEAGEEMTPVADKSNEQAQISNHNPAEDPLEILPDNSSTSLDNVFPEESTLTSVGHSFSAPVEEATQWQLQISAHSICAIPIVNPSGLIFKLCAGRIDLSEEQVAPVSGSAETLPHKDAKSGDPDATDDYDSHPSVRGRIELGPQIYKYYPTLEELHIPCVVQLHVNGVNASLLLPLMENLANMFEDELQSSIPVPLYIVLEGNQFIMLQSPDGRAEDFNTLNVSVNKVCIQRGPEVPKLAVWKAERLEGEISVSACYREITPMPEALGSSTASNMAIDSAKSKELDALLTSIKTFTSSLQPQIQKLGSLLHVQRINEVMLDLQNVISTSEHLDPPPQYSESVDHRETSATIASLHKEIESLQENQKLMQEQIKSNQEQLQAKDAELSHMVSELVKSKDSEVTMKEVVFRLNNQIQDVVMENDQLKVIMARNNLHVPVSKRH